MHFVRYKIRAVEKECDILVFTPSDYAIILKRLSQDITIEAIEAMINEVRTTLTEEER